MSTLTLRRLATAADAALDNCESLLTDARLLREAGRYPRAHALAVLAAEEFGKSLMCQYALVRDLDYDEEGASYFMRTFRKHEVKLRNALLQVDVFKDARGGRSGRIQRPGREVDRSGRRREQPENEWLQ